MKHHKNRKTAGLWICMFVLLFSLTVCRAENTESTASDDRDLLLSFDYGDEVTYVIGHKSPDSDTVGSAIAYADLLNEIGIRAEAVVSAPVNNETQFALDTFGIAPPPVMDHAEGKQFVLVDHSTFPLLPGVRRSCHAGYGPDHAYEHPFGYPQYDPACNICGSERL